MKISTHYTRAASFAIAVITLVAVGALLAGLLLTLLHMASRAEGERHDYLAKLASLTMGALMLDVLILVGMVIRYVAQRLTNPPEPFKPMGYVDAWTEGGRRLKPEDAPPIEGFEDTEGQNEQPQQDEPE